jgi:Galactose oxidase-like, Early set domain
MTPISVIHAALLHTGNVLFIADAYSSDTVIWDPEDPVEATAFRLLGGASTGLGSVSLACSGHCHLSDGKVLAVGGDSPARATAYKFDPVTEQWLPAGTMGFVRWYPTCVKLGDDSGRVLVVGGTNVSNAGTAVPQMEIYNESSDTFTRVWGPAGMGDTSADRSFPKLYPGLHPTPNGEIFHTRVGDRSGADRSATFAFTALDRGQWTEVTEAVTDQDRPNGMSVLVLRRSPTDPDRVLVVGGGAGTTATTIAVMDIPASTTSMWLTGSFPDGVARYQVNAVALPDCSVFICGGIPPTGTPTNGGAAMLYRPPTGPGLGTLSTMDTLQYARQHHSTALLLPSGKVMCTGDTSNTIEVFSPPYLFDSVGAPLPESARPDITSFPDPSAGTIVLHGSTFTVGTSNPASIDRVVMVKPMAVTHQTDTEQRVIRLEHTVSGPSSLSVIAPDGRVYPYGPGGGHTHAIAGRGYYMLFLLNTAGVPSRAKFIRLV